MKNTFLNGSNGTIFRTSLRDINPYLLPNGIEMRDSLLFCRLMYPPHPHLAREKWTPQRHWHNASVALIFRRCIPKRCCFEIVDRALFCLQNIYLPGMCFRLGHWLNNCEVRKCNRRFTHDTVI